MSFVRATSVLRSATRATAPRAPLASLCAGRPARVVAPFVRTRASGCALPRALSTSALRRNAPPASAEAEEPGQAQAQGLALEPKLQLTFTCTVPDCNTRSTHEFTRRSYQKGIVLVQCPGCKNRHLIADNLGWFKDSHEPRTVEQMVAANGGRVARGTKLLGADDQGETIEITSDSHPDRPASPIPAPKKDK